MSKTPIYARNVPLPGCPVEVLNHSHMINTIASWIKPEIYLELGVRDSPVLVEMHKHAKKIIGIDLQLDRNYINTLKNKVSSDFDKYTFIETSTDRYFESIKGTDICFDMVFIDADHCHTSSLRDFDNVFPYVNEDGIILLHDTYPINDTFVQPRFCGDSYKTAEYIRKNYHDKCEIFTMPVQPGLSIVRKCSKQLYWM